MPFPHDRTHPHQDLSVREFQVLQGHMLGDGCLYLGESNKSPSLSMTRTAGDLEYLKWSADVFRSRLTPSSVTSWNTFDQRTSKTYYSVGLRTRCDPAFTVHRSQWYEGRRKRVPQDMQLSSLAVAVWLADDGSVTRSSRRSPEIKFATHSFTRQEVCYLAELLTGCYGGPFHVHQVGERQQYVIRTSGKPAKTLLRDVDNVFPPLDRKANRWRHTELLTERVTPPDCPRCESPKVYYWAKSSKGVQQFKCCGCSRVFREDYERPGRDPRMKGQET